MTLIMLLLTVVTGCCNVAATALTSTDNDSGDHLHQGIDDYPGGDPRRCLEIARRNKYNMERFEVLPGFGWDNLRNVYEGQVVSFNYSQCRTTDDGRFLLPDSVSAVPIKSSRVQTFAEIIMNWQDWTSSNSRSINVDVGLDLKKFSISGKFSSEFDDVKSKQIGDKSVTTRAQVRYVRYSVQLQPDTPLHPVFKNRVLNIAAARELGQQDQARFLSQLLVRDFGTHVVTKADAGAALEQVDQIKESYASDQTVQKSTILASASASLFEVFKLSVSYETSSDQTATKTYKAQRTSSNILTQGGPLFKPVNFTSDIWAAKVDRDLVALDRAGDPLYYVITGALFPELPASVLNEVYENVKEAVEIYYAYNMIPGCLDKTSPDFSPIANTDDGSCKPPPYNLTFGGVYQTCVMQSGSNYGDLCSHLRQVNPKTGDYSCPPNYQAVKLHSGSKSSSRVEHVCKTVWLFWHKCHDDYYHSNAVYDMYWCVATGTVPPDSGYLFGGLFTSRVDNPVTQAFSCPPTFFPLNIGSEGDLHVCISDDYEFGLEHSLPFAGFISCSAGNPLAVADNPNQTPSQGHLKATRLGPEPRGNLKAFFRDQAGEWPMRCPDGFSRHLATVDQGCQINYCVRTGAMNGPILPPVKRPPFVPAPPLPAPSSDNVVVFDPLTNTWKRNKAAMEMMSLSTSQTMGSSSPGGAADVMSPGTAAGISVGATLGCVIIATLAVAAVRAKRRRSNAGYRRLQNPLLEPQGDYGSVNSVASSGVGVRVSGGHSGE